MGEKGKKGSKHFEVGLIQGNETSRMTSRWGNSARTILVRERVKWHMEPLVESFFPLLELVF